MEKIFESYSYRELSLNNRIVRSATNDYSGNMDGTISKIQLDLYDTLANAEIGLIITGNFYVSDDGRLDVSQNSIAMGTFDLKGARELTRVIHDKGAKVIFQIAHAGRKTKVNHDNIIKYDIANAISQERIQKLISEFADASERCLIAGADGVQIHFGHGYLLGELLEERTDGIEIAENIFQRIRNTVNTYPVLVKINSDMESTKLTEFYRLCQRYKIWAVELSGSDFFVKSREEHNYYEAAINMAKQNCEASIILTGGVRSRQDGEKSIKAGADLVGMSRPFISEPNLIKSGWKKQSRCISCCKCFQLYKEIGKRCVFEV